MKKTKVTLAVILITTVFSMLSVFGIVEKIIPEPWNILLSIIVLGPCLTYLILFLERAMKKK
ncbi:MAG: hypothetical protein PHW34_05140 [Hespellia sp.]|nr:hypothetical protein [Hespellia sp.]